MPALLAFAPAILELLMMLIRWFGEKTLNEKQAEEFFRQWKSLARTLNLQDLAAKHDAAEEQLEATERKWREIIAAEEAAKKEKK